MNDNNEKQGMGKILNELVQPFIDLAHTSRALFGLNLSYVIEGLVYFGIVGLLAIFFNQYIGLDDIDAGRMVGFLTAGITIAMLFLGATVDWIGLRKAILISLFFMLAGRIILALSPSLGSSRLWGGAHLFSILGIVGIIIGYGIYQPAAYAGVKQFTNSKTSAMGYAMLYALMNLGGFIPALIQPSLRKSFGIDGVFWAYSVFTIVGIAVVAIVMSKKAIAKAIADAKNLETEFVEEEVDEMLEMSAKDKLKFYLKNFPLLDNGSCILFLF